MTLVAAFRINSVPIIVGDLLVTDAPGSGPHNFLPTRPDLGIDSVTERRRSGVFRKVLQLGDHLIVAFTGNIDAGSVLFKDLQHRFKNSAPSEDALSFAFRLHNIQFSRRASVVGWLADPTPRCFTWSARPGATLQWVTHAILGSGAQHFERQILPIQYSDSAVFDDLSEQARFVAITKSASVLSSELSSAENLKNYYGYGLDIAVWSNGKFSFQEKVVFTYYNALLLPNGAVQIQPILIRIYEHYDRYSLLQTRSFFDAPGPDGKIGQMTFVEMVTTLHDDCADIPMPKNLLSPNSSVYCFGIAYSDKTSGTHGFAHFTVDRQNVVIEGDETKFSLRLRDSQQVTSMLREIIRSAVANRTSHEQSLSHL